MLSSANKKYDSFNTGYNKTADGAYKKTIGNIIELTQIRYMTEVQWYQCIKDMKGNDFKLFSYLHIKSQKYDSIPWSPSVIEQEIQINRRSLRIALDSLIELGYAREENNSYIIRII